MRMLRWALQCLVKKESTLAQTLGGFSEIYRATILSHYVVSKLRIIQRVPNEPYIRATSGQSSDQPINAMTYPDTGGDVPRM
jgi:hypothetical protein